MRAGATAVGILGAMLALIGATGALIMGRADTAIIGGWVTLGAAIAVPNLARGSHEPATAKPTRTISRKVQ